MSMIGAKEIIRPGIAGPFWSDIQFGYDGPIDVTEWMLDILERRQGPEPSDMPYNGLDFYLHELCDGSLNAIARMLKSGHKALALETATETHGVVAGMKDMLLDLGDDADLVFAHGAWEHLARYYQCLHPKATQCAEIQHYPQWALGADAFVIRQGGGDTFRDLMIIYSNRKIHPSPPL